MSPLAVVGLTLLALAAAVVAMVRRGRLRAAAREAALHDAIRDVLGDELAIGDDHLSLAGGAYRLSRARLLAAVARHEDPATVAQAACSLLRRPLRRLRGPLSLKLHGTRIQVHLVRPGVLDLLPREPRLARRELPELGLTATYRVDGDADRCLSEDHLRDQGVDTTDVHGIAIAVLRQHFDESLIERLVAGGHETIETADGSAAALLLVLPDFLPPGSRVMATLEGPDQLTLAPRRESGPEDGGSGLELSIDDRGVKVL